MPGPAREAEFLHLVRLDGVRVRGWQLRLPPWHPEGPLTRLFSDSLYGDAQASYRAARQERDRAFSRHELPLQIGGRVANALNTSGLVGVMLKHDHRRGRSGWLWVALWSENKKARRRAFAASRWGFEGAFWKAVELRQRRTGLIYTNEQIRQARQLWPAV